MSTRETAQAKLGQIQAVLKTPGGFGRLNPNQKKFIYGVVLSSVVPSDNVVRESEMAVLQRQLSSFLGLAGEAKLEAQALAETPPLDAAAIDQLAGVLTELLGVHDRAAMIRHLWELALADDELHASEERLVYRIADVSGVPRKQVAEQLARVAAQS